MQPTDRPAFADAPELAQDLCAFVDASPSPFHAVAETARRLEAAGFRRLEEVDAWERPAAGGARHYFERGGSLVAWVASAERAAHAGFHVVAAHTDSPNLRVKAKPNTAAAGFRQLGVEVYGGVLLNSWLDRDLGLSGRVMVRTKDGGSEARLLKVDRPLARVPQLAIHLNREVNEQGLALDKQRHMSPVWSVGPADGDGLERFVAGELGCAPEDIRAWDLMLHDVQGSRVIGREEEMIAAPRLDNLASCHAGLKALERALDGGAEPGHTPVLCLFDHEEVGSSSRAGAGGSVLEALLDRVVAVAGARTRTAGARAPTRSACRPTWPTRRTRTTPRSTSRSTGSSSTPAR